MDVQQGTTSTAMNVVTVSGLVVSALVCAGVAFVGMFSGMLSAGCAQEAAARCDDIARWMMIVTIGGAPLVWIIGLALSLRSERAARALWAWAPLLAALLLLQVASQMEQYAYTLG